MAAKKKVAGAKALRDVKPTAKKAVKVKGGTGGLTKIGTGTPVLSGK